MGSLESVFLCLGRVPVVFVLDVGIGSIDGRDCSGYDDYGGVDYRDTGEVSDGFGVIFPGEFAHEFVGFIFGFAFCW